MLSEQEVIIAEEFANSLRLYRSRHALSQRDLAKLLGVTQPVLARWESGRHVPMISTLCKMLSAIGMVFDVHVGPTMSLEASCG